MGDFKNRTPPFDLLSHWRVDLITWKRKYEKRASGLANHLKITIPTFFYFNFKWSLSFVYFLLCKLHPDSLCHQHTSKFTWNQTETAWFRDSRSNWQDTPETGDQTWVWLGCLGVMQTGLELPVAAIVGGETTVHLRPGDLSRLPGWSVASQKPTPWRGTSDQSEFRFRFHVLGCVLET